VYVDKSRRVWILDFNVFGEPTNPLLYDWSELVDIANDHIGTGSGEEVCELRVVRQHSEVQSGSAAASRGPLEAVTCVFRGMSDFIEMCREQQAEEDEDSSI
jgi:D123